MDGAWYRAAGLAYGYFASLCAVLIALLLLKRWRSEVSCVPLMNYDRFTCSFHRLKGTEYRKTGRIEL